MTSNILVICSDDVCLGPTIAASLRSALDHALVLDVHVTSAGVRTVSGRHRCPEAVEAGASRAEPVQVTTDLVGNADLVLTTESRFRGSARLLDMHSAARTYTLLEAAMLGRLVADSPRTIDNRPAARRLAEEMDARRGLAAPPAQAGGWFGSRRARVAVGFDLTDPHAGGASHRAIFAEVERAVHALALPFLQTAHGSLVG